MKIRDLFFLVVLAAVALAALRPAPAPHPDAPRSGILKRVIKWVALWYVVGEQPPVPNYESQPVHVVNALPEREIGPDGVARIDHGAAW
jgi:hypothetical protein